MSKSYHVSPKYNRFLAFLSDSYTQNMSAFYGYGADGMRAGFAGNRTLRPARSSGRRPYLTIISKSTSTLLIFDDFGGGI